MFSLQTPVFPTELPVKINHSDKIFTIGSCFSDSIGILLRNSGIISMTNPHGAQYNPISISKTLLKILKKENYTNEDVFYNGNVWLSWYHYSNIYSNTMEDLLKQINSNIIIEYEFLKATDWLIITPVTSNVFYHLINNDTVSNCHKQNPSLFIHKTMSIEDILLNFNSLIDKLQNINPKIKIIFTVSPVRYKNKNPLNNTLSKSNLFAAISKILETFSCVYYFPAYEIMMDELRDYRFYASDLTHPSDLAVKIIFQKFKNACIDKSAFPLIEEIESYRNLSSHKIIHPNTIEHTRIINQLRELREKLMAKYPYLVDIL